MTASSTPSLTLTCFLNRYRDCCRLPAPILTCILTRYYGFCLHPLLTPLSITRWPGIVVAAVLLPLLSPAYWLGIAVTPHSYLHVDLPSPIPLSPACWPPPLSPFHSHLHVDPPPPPPFPIPLSPACWPPPLPHSTLTCMLTRYLGCSQGQGGRCSGSGWGLDPASEIHSGWTT